ncbi:MFS transporter [Pseudoclavibacter sp. AY1H1]|uniref:MFS transporter n=1 Tax=Pseudoclavibacter sp. AY1H1 TaxID=2080584 RepID=UPI0015E3E7DD|nr:MFS transporter [Pseudoclavibacter sp. AY1H1]
MTSLTSSPLTSAPKLPLVPLIALAFSTFISVTIEMLPTGLLELMTVDLGATRAEIGWLMTIFAFTVVLTSTPLTALTKRVPRHALLVVVLAVFAIGSIASAFAPTYAWLVVTRVITGLAHGVFWAVVASYISLIAPRELLTRAVSITLGGGAIAYVLGVPIGTALGQAFGWRFAFGSLAVITLLVAVLLWFLLPRVNHLDDSFSTRPIALPDDSDGPAVPVKRIRFAQRSLLTVILLCVITLITMTAQYAFYSYISPYSLDVIGFPVATLSLVLFAYGIASAGGTALAGVVFTARPRVGLATGYLLMLVAVTLLLFAHDTTVALIALVIWGLGMGVLPPLLQSRILNAAPSRHRDLSSALYTSGFNFGIGSGALVGGLLLDAAGLVALPVFFIAMVGLGLVSALVLDAVLARRPLQQSN